MCGLFLSICLLRILELSRGGSCVSSVLRCRACRPMSFGWSRRTVAGLILLSSWIMPLPGLNANTESATGDPLSRQSIHGSLVRLQITTARYSAARPWRREVGSTYEVTGLVRPGGRILLSAGPVQHAVNIQVRRHGSYKQFEGRVLVVDLEANLAMVVVEDPEFFQGLSAIPYSSDPGPGKTYKAVRVDDRFNIETSEVTVSELVPIADYGFTRLPVAIFRSDPSFKAGGLILDDRGIVGMIGFVDGEDKAEAVFSSRLRDFESMVKKASPPARAPEGQPGKKPDGYQGFPAQGFFFASLEDPALRQYYGVKKEHGVLITTVLDGCSVSDYFRAGDVLIELDGYEVSPAGDYLDPELGWQPVDLLFVRDVRGRPRKVGEKLSMTIVRQGKEKKLQVPLKAYSGGAERIPWTISGAPSYLMHEGFLFLELSVPFLKERFGSKWETRALALSYLYEQKKYYKPGEKKDRILVLSDILPAESTRGYEQFVGEQVVSVNGKEVDSLAQLKETLENREESRAVLELRSGRKIYMSTGQGNEDLRRRYGIAEKSRIDSPN